jgi:uncharacterized membrane protein YhaH (DUF805 family)
MIGFPEAIRNGFDQYLSAKGRASRAEYWWWWLLVAVLSALTEGSVLGSLILLALFIPSVTVLVRRLHDTGRSGWSLLIVLVPFVGFIALLYFLVQPGDTASNRYGPPRAPGPSATGHGGPVGGWLGDDAPPRAGGWDDLPPPPPSTR